MPYNFVMRSRESILGSLLVLVALAALLPLPAESGRRWDGSPDPRPRSNGGPGNLSVSDLAVFEIGAGSTSQRYLVRAIVENRVEVSLSAPWRVELFREGHRDPLAECDAPGLEGGRVAVCEIWLHGSAIDEGEVIAARLDRSLDDYDDWDGDPTDDARSTRIRTILPGGRVLRIASWDVQPRVLHGRSQAQFNFTIEGGHLVWLLVGGEAPKLLAGHPADGLMTGRSSVLIERSGPVTLVARNSLGAFVYETIPVLNTYEEPAIDWGEEPAEDGMISGAPRVSVLAEGVYEVEENKVILDHLGEYLSQRDWTRALGELGKAAGRARVQPEPANALNPAREKQLP